MDLLNLPNVSFREFVHTPDMDSRCVHRVQGRIVVLVLESRLTLDVELVELDWDLAELRLFCQF